MGGKQKEDPFAPVGDAVEEMILSEEKSLDDYLYTDVLPNGDVVTMKMESGVPVVVENRGKVKDWFNRALKRASMLTPGEADELELSDMTHIEIASLRLAMNAAAGSLDAMKELLDRVLGKSRQINENYNANLSLDDLLTGKSEGETVDSEIIQEGEVDSA